MGNFNRLNLNGHNLKCETCSTKRGMGLKWEVLGPEKDEKFSNIGPTDKRLPGSVCVCVCVCVCEYVYRCIIV